MTAKLNPTLGPEVVAWIETNLIHGPGDIQGTAVELDEERTRFIYTVYEVHPKDHPWAGRRVYPRAFLSRPKGWAKSELAAMIACAEVLGPVRFAGLAWKQADRRPGDLPDHQMPSPPKRARRAIPTTASSTCSPRAS